MSENAVSIEFRRSRKMHPFLKAALWGGGAYLGYRMIQAATDVEFPGRRLPRLVRDAFKENHIAEHGEFCLCCRTDTVLTDLVIDHIFPFAKGGRTSLANSRVVCRWCNGAKSDKVTLGERLQGRGGRRRF